MAQLVLHSDLGAQMTSFTVADVLENLAGTRVHGQQRHSPNGEAAFKAAP